jgi:hypothetical protein
MSNQTVPAYTVRAASPLPDLGEGWNHPAWAAAETAALTHFRPEGSSHRPRAQVRLLHGAGGIRGVFHIDDQYVSSIRVGYLTHVWKDSCVEFFMRPRPDRGYFNLEMNAGGSHLCNYIEDPTRIPDGFKKFTPLPPEWGGKFQVRSSLPQKIDPEIVRPVSWEMNFFVPLAVLEHYVGPLGAMKGQSWRGNFYKCGDETSHPHWGSWSPVDVFNFHTPRCFGVIHFE